MHGSSRMPWHGSSTPPSCHPRAAAVGPRLQNARRDAPALRPRLPHRCGGSRPSTSTSASSRRARAPSMPSTERASTTTSEREVEWVMGACFLRPSRRATTRSGRSTSGIFLFSEEVDWMRRAADAGLGRSCSRRPRECVHVGGAAHGGRMFRENVRGHLRYLSLHGGPGEAEQAREAPARVARWRAAGCIAASAAASTARPPAGSARATSRRCSPGEADGPCSRGWSSPRAAPSDRKHRFRRTARLRSPRARPGRRLRLRITGGAGFLARNVSASLAQRHPAWVVVADTRESN